MNLTYNLIIILLILVMLLLAVVFNIARKRKISLITIIIALVAFVMLHWNAVFGIFLWIKDSGVSN